MSSSTTPEPEPAWRDALKLAAVTVVWLLLARYLERLGSLVIPDAWKARIQLQTFLIACQMITGAVGVGLTFALLARPREVLALVRPRARDVAGAALLAPAVFVGASVVALEVALPTLLAEARARGPQVSRENAGEFGRTLEQSPIFATIFWGVILAAVTEELLFRGALWSAVDRAVRRVLPPRDGDRARAFLLGLAPTLVAAAVFAIMHGDLRGGVGLVRIVSTFCLALACGLGRNLTGTIAAPVAVHLVHNTLALGQTRRWFASPGPPLLESLPIPDRLLGLALSGLVGVALLWALTTIAARRADRERALRLEE